MIAHPSTRRTSAQLFLIVLCLYIAILGQRFAMNSVSGDSSPQRKACIVWIINIWLLRLGSIAAEVYKLFSTLLSMALHYLTYQDKLSVYYNYSYATTSPPNTFANGWLKHSLNCLLGYFDDEADTSLQSKLLCLISRVGCCPCTVFSLLQLRRLLTSQDRTTQETVRWIRRFISSL